MTEGSKQVSKLFHTYKDIKIYYIKIYYYKHTI